MKPTLVLVGRPNVGKSTLFNRLTRTRDALVADQPGLTRDRQYGTGRIGDQAYFVIDTAGFDPVARSGMMHEMARQAEQALVEADALLFIVDARSGLSAHDEQIAERLRRVQRPVWVLVNKAEGRERHSAVADFHRLGLGQPFAVSAAHGDGVRAVIEAVLESLPAHDSASAATAHGEPETGGDEKTAKVPQIAIAGRPNVGKSTLVNALLGEERMIAFDQPGTTRDAIRVAFEHQGRQYDLIDTAGVRRRARVSEAVEKFSVIKTLQAIEQSNVVVLVLDGTQDIAEQDAHIASFALDSGRAMVVVVNKWDALDRYAREQVQMRIEQKLGFLKFARFHYLSALKGQGLNGLMRSVDGAWAAASANLSTPRLTRTLQAAVARQEPPRQGAFRPKMRYAHQGGMNPPVIVIHGSGLERIGASYVRYLERSFLEAFRLRGTPLRIQFKSGHNPYAAGR